MENLDLDIDNYNLNELLSLFKLDAHFDKQDLKIAKKVVIMIDDLHLQSNLKINIVEFMRTWTQSNGYFDVGAGFFKRITDFSIIMA